MTYNGGKLIVVGLLAVALILAIMLGDNDEATWAVPLLTMLIGYVIGNSQVTSQEGATRPLAQKDYPMPPPSP